MNENNIETESKKYAYEVYPVGCLGSDCGNACTNKFCNKDINDAFIAGAEFANKWIDVDTEKPKNGEVVLVKYKTANQTDKIGIATYHNPFGIIGGFVIQGSCPRYITHWRRI